MATKTIEEKKSVLVDAAAGKTRSEWIEDIWTEGGRHTYLSIPCSVCKAAIAARCVCARLRFESRITDADLESFASHKQKQQTLLNLVVNNPALDKVRDAGKFELFIGKLIPPDACCHVCSEKITDMPWLNNDVYACYSCWQLLTRIYGPKRYM